MFSGPFVFRGLSTRKPASIAFEEQDDNLFHVLTWETTLGTLKAGKRCREVLNR